MITEQKYPTCPHCGGSFRPGVHWLRSNYCKAAYLIRVLAANPGVSTWEISQLSGLAYSDAVKGMNKARALQVVVAEPEERAQGGIRFRHYVLDNWEDVCNQLLEDPPMVEQGSFTERSG